MSTWVEPVAPADVDLETIEENKNTIKVNNVDSDDRDRPAIWAINSNAGASALALRVDGKLEVNGHMVNANDSIEVDAEFHVNDLLAAEAQLHVVGGITAESYALIDGRISAGDINDANNAALHATNSNIGANARAVKATGMSEMVANVNVDADTTGLKVSNASARAGSRALMVDGKSQFDGATTFNNDVTFDDGEVTCNVELHVDNTLFAEENLHVEGDIRGIGGITLDGNIDLEGQLTVGPENSAGIIDAGGAVLTPQNLKIGTGTTTNDVQLGRAGQNFDIFTQARHNSNGVVLNDDASLTAGTGIGFIVNAVGHGNGPSIDFYVNGAVQGWLDTTGFVNA